MPCGAEKKEALEQPTAKNIVRKGGARGIGILTFGLFLYRLEGEAPQKFVYSRLLFAVAPPWLRIVRSGSLILRTWGRRRPLDRLFKAMRY